MMSPQEGRYTKVAAMAGVIGLVIAFLAWIHPFAPRSEASASDMGKMATSSEPTAQTPQPPLLTSDHFGTGSDSNQHAASGSTSAKPEPGGKVQGDDSGNSRGFRRSIQSCGVPDVATLRPGAPAKMASGLAVLSVKTAREGSEPYVTLSVTSDRDTLSKAILGAPVRYRFATSRGAYFVNVTDVDLADGAVTVQVGCEAKENTPRS
jgi:hypothetical protein